MRSWTVDEVPSGTHRPRTGGPAHSNAYYDLQCDAYAARTGVAGTPPLMRAFLAALPPAGEVADLGCGAGRDLALLVEQGMRCVGYDLSPRLAELARVRSGAPVLVADVRSLELPDQSLDGVLAVASLLHLELDEIVGVLARIARWLRPGGVFLSTMKEGGASALDGEGRRFNLVKAAAWEAMLGNAGLHVVGTVGSQADPGVSSSGHSWIAALARRPAQA